MNWHRTTPRLPAGLVAAIVAVVVLVAVVAPRVHAQSQTAKPLQPAKKATERVVIRELPFVIDVPGRYVLAGGLSALPHPDKGGEFGIAIVCDNVELDLDGAILLGAVECTSGIVAVLPGKREELFNVTVRNGTLMNWPAWGLDLSVVRQARVADVQLLQNGLPVALRDGVPGGLRVGAAGRVTDCSSLRNAGAGIAVGEGSLVRACIADENGGAGVVLGQFATAAGCTATRNTGAGIVLSGAGARATDCAAGSNGAEGVLAVQGGFVQGCSVTANAGYGVVAQRSCVVSGCVASGNAQGGVLATLGNNRIESNHVAGGVGGIEVRGANNLVVGNSVTGSPLPYTIAERNVVGPIHRGETGPDALIIRSAGAGGAAPGALLDPPPAWANFAP
jgi:hypothetical protein